MDSHLNDNNCIIGKKCGTITVSIYKETNSGSPIFYVKSDTEEFVAVSDIIEDTLAMY